MLTKFCRFLYAYNESCHGGCHGWGRGGACH